MIAVRYAILLLCCIVPAGLSAEERLVYALTLPSASGSATELFAVGPGDAQPVRLFSDASSPTVLGFMPQTATGAPFETAVIGNRLFSPGKERGSGDSRRATGIYEFALDASGKSRKILDIPAGERVDILTVGNNGAKLAYLSLSASSLTFFIHDTATGRLLHKIDMTKIAGGCAIANAGWLPDDQTLFFALQEGADSFMEDIDYKHVGSWLMNEDGTQLRKLPDSLGKIKLQGTGYRTMGGPVMVGVVHGQYLVDSRVYQISDAKDGRGFLALFNPESGTNTSIPIGPAPGLAEFVLAGSGNYFAFVRRDPTKFVASRPVAPIEHIWIQPLPTGNAKEVFSFQTDVQHRTALTLMGWMSE